MNPENVDAEPDAHEEYSDFDEGSDEDDQLHDSDAAESRPAKLKTTPMSSDAHGSEHDALVRLLSL